MTTINLLSLPWLMFKKLCVFLQYLLPQHGLSKLAGRIANSRHVKFKNFLIRQFMRVYKIKMQEAVLADPYAYPTFNDFFIRQLKPNSRPITANQQEIASPVDGTVSQMGKINEQQLLQAKNFYFDLDTLLGGDKTLSQQFINGEFATFYLAPQNYHRVHMPLTGKLTQTIYVPGRLFSVNTMTSKIIPQLYSRNERYISIFDTEVGPMAVILVGALIVGSIQTVWMQEAIRGHHIINQRPEPRTLEKGAELGYFKLGSTVIVLLPQDKTIWLPFLKPHSPVEFGKPIGNLLPN